MNYTALFLLMLMSFLAQRAQACACAPIDQHAATLMERANGIIIATAGATRALDNKTVSTTFGINKVIKGNYPSSMPIATAKEASACGIQFEQGKTYLVLVYKDKNGLLTTDYCSAGESADPTIASAIFEFGKIVSNP